MRNTNTSWSRWWRHNQQLTSRQAGVLLDIVSQPEEGGLTQIRCNELIVLLESSN